VLERPIADGGIPLQRVVRVFVVRWGARWTKSRFHASQIPVNGTLVPLRFPHVGDGAGKKS